MPPLIPPGPIAAPAPSSSAGAMASVRPAESGTWGRPVDPPSQAALALAAALLLAAVVPAGCAWLASLLDFAGLPDLARKRRFLGVAAFVASFLSLGYIAFYLRGGPRDALAPVYWLQGRALEHGELSWTAADPLASFRAAHLLSARPDRVAGIFPPGYPLLLSAGFLLGAPMLVGPLLAASLVVATWALASELARAAGLCGERAEVVARTAVGLSILSAAMRHFTADTLPAGAAAVAVTAAAASALRARRLGDRRFFALAGLCAGAVLAIQTASAVPVGGLVLSLAVGVPPVAAPLRRRGRDPRAVLWALLAALPFVLLLLAANRAAAGRALSSPAALYFATLGAGGPALAASASGGVGALLQLRAHLADVANLEPLALLAVVPFVGRAPGRTVALVGLVVPGLLVVSLLAGPADGGVERGLVCAVPIEHALVALALAQLFPLALPRAAVTTLALALLGFAVHTARDHRRLAAADLGRPHYEPDVVRDASVASGLLYFDDDQGFELAFDPEVPASHGILAARMRGDDNDRLLYDLLGHPPIHRYSALGPAASVVAWTPPNENSDTWRFEAESDWPALAVQAARVEVAEGAAPCASEGRGLTVTPSASGPVAEGSAALPLPVPRGAALPERRTWSVAPRAILRGGSGSATLELVTSAGPAPVARWTWQDAASSPACVDLPAQTVELGGERPRAWLVLHAAGGAVTLDKTTLRPR